MKNEKNKINNEFYTVEDLRKGYDTITGCNNEEMTDRLAICSNTIMGTHHIKRLSTEEIHSVNSLKYLARMGENGELYRCATNCATVPKWDNRQDSNLRHTAPKAK